MSEEVAEMVEAQAEQPQVEQTETPNEENAAEEQQEGESDVDYKARYEEIQQQYKTVSNLAKKQKHQFKEFKRQQQQEREQYEATRKELEAFKAPKPPKEDEFDSVMDFINAKIEYQAQQGRQPQGEQPLSQEQLEQQFRAKLYAEQQVQTVVTQAQELSQKIPDAAMAFQSGGEALEDLPPFVAQAIQEADQGALALYHLVKTGELESLASMSPTQAAMAVARAEYAGQKYLTKPTTQAPAPLKGAKGTGKASKDINSMTADELLASVS